MIEFGSVCSGIEAASVAWHPLGWRAAWLAEIEAFPSAVLAHHYPDVPNLGDMTRLVRRILSGEIAAPDVFTGGTPCQAFSVAGKRESLDDARGNLTLTFCEIANAIDHVRTAAGREPCVVMWENVPGVLSTRDNAFGCFLAALAGSGCELRPAGHRPGQPERWPNAGVVYGPRRTVAWRVLDAQYFGLAQRRRRVFVVASARNGFDPAAVLFESDGLRRDTAPRREAGEGSAVGTLAGTSPGGGWRVGADEAAAGQLIPALARCVTTGEAKRQDWESCTIIPAPTSEVVGTLTSAGGNAVPGNTVQDAVAHQLIPMTAHTLRAEGFDASEDGTGRGTPLVPIAFGGQMSAPQTDVDLSQTLQAKNPQAVATSMAVRRLTPRECERLQGFPTVVEFPEADMTRDEVIALALAAGYLKVDAAAGRVFRLRGPGGVALAQPEEVGTRHPSGYLVGTVRVGKVRKQVRLHRVVWIAANGIPSDDVVIDHINNDKADNRIANLQTLTSRENSHKAREDGLYDFDDHPGTKLTAEVRDQLFHDYATNGGSYSELAARYGITKGRVGQIIRERDYTAIPWRGKPAGDCPDGPRYKALGNSWAVPCARWIGERMARALA